MICSGTSEPQLKAISGEIHQQIKKEHGVSPHAVDGFPASQWIVMDYGDVVVHIFHALKRDFYGLEELWSDAPRLALTEKSSAVKPDKPNPKPRVKPRAKKVKAAPRDE